MTEHRPDGSWIRQAIRQAPWRTQTQASSLVLAVVVMVAVIGALYLAQASRTAAAGRRLQELEVQRQALEQQNAQLRAEIAALRSVPRLIGEAEKLGFHNAKQDEVEYIVIEEVPAALGATPTPIPTMTELVPTYDETLDSWLSEQMAVFRERFGAFWQRTFGSEGESDG
jgi:type II secretory pathway pseudopilin PulG